jgi:hypothetical protein
MADLPQQFLDLTAGIFRLVAGGVRPLDLGSQRLPIDLAQLLAQLLTHGTALLVRPEKP